MTDIPDELLELETELRSLRPNAPRVMILRPAKPRTVGYPWIAVALLFGLVMGGTAVERIRPAPVPVEIVRYVEVPATQSSALEVTAAQPPALQVAEIKYRPLNLDEMFEEYNHRAKLFAGVRSGIRMSSPSNGSISDPLSAFRLRETLNL